jgi:hypothetical protein
MCSRKSSYAFCISPAIGDRRIREEHKEWFCLPVRQLPPYENVGERIGSVRYFYLTHERRVQPRAAVTARRRGPCGPSASPA